MDHAAANPEFELRDAGLRPTVARLQLLELFHARPDRGLTAEGIYRALLEQGRPLPLPSIYRALPQLEKAGLLRRGELAGQRGVYRLGGEGAAVCGQLVCTRCGHAEPLADAEIDARLRVLARQRGFEPGARVLALQVACVREPCEHRAGAQLQPNAA